MLEKRTAKNNNKQEKPTHSLVCPGIIRNRSLTTRNWLITTHESFQREVPMAIQASIIQKSAKIYKECNVHTQNRLMGAVLGNFVLNFLLAITIFVSVCSQV